jgi:hypothetical protein
VPELVKRDGIVAFLVLENLKKRELDAVLEESELPAFLLHTVPVRRLTFGFKAKLQRS